MINRSCLSQKKIRFVIPKADNNKQNQNNPSHHFLYDHDKFNEVMEELIIAVDKFDHHHYQPSKIKEAINE
jgi:hypothetical protein